MAVNAKHALPKFLGQDHSTMADEGAGIAVSPSELLAMMPYGEQFLFVDEIVEADETHVATKYRFRSDAFFYRAHFVDRPTTPGVILLEAMAQCGIVAQGLYLRALEAGKANARRCRFLLSRSEVDWYETVAPGASVTIRSQLLGWKVRCIRARVQMLSEKNASVAEALVVGTGVSWDPVADRRNSLEKSPADHE